MLALRHTAKRVSPFLSLSLIPARYEHLMTAVRIKEAGPDAKLSVEQTSVPQPGEGQVLVKVSSCGVCYRDLIDKQGGFPFIKQNIITGHEIAGVVEKTGSKGAIERGDKVVSLHWAPCGGCPSCLEGKTTVCVKAPSSFLGLTQDGGYAQYACLPEASLVPLPKEITDHFSASEAAVVQCTFGTTWHALSRAAIKPGETILVTGSSGGVGSATVQLASAMGCKVIGVSSSPEKEDYIKSLGASTVIPAKDFHKNPAVKGGVDIVMEAVGAPTFMSALRSLRGEKRLCLVGNVTNASVNLPLGLCIIKGYQIIGSDSCTAQELLDVFTFMKENNIRPNIQKEFSIEEAEAAQHVLASKGVTGRVVLKMSQSSW